MCDIRVAQVKGFCHPGCCSLVLVLVVLSELWLSLAGSTIMAEAVRVNGMDDDDAAVAGSLKFHRRCRIVYQILRVQNVKINAVLSAVAAAFGCCSTVARYGGEMRMNFVYTVTGEEGRQVALSRNLFLLQKFALALSLHQRNNYYPHFGCCSLFEHSIWNFRDWGFLLIYFQFRNAMRCKVTINANRWFLSWSWTPELYILINEDTIWEQDFCKSFKLVALMSWFNVVFKERRKMYRSFIFSTAVYGQVALWSNQLLRIPVSIYEWDNKETLVVFISVSVAGTSLIPIVFDVTNIS